MEKNAPLAEERSGLNRVMLLVRDASAEGRLVRLAEAAAEFLPEVPPETATARLHELLPEAGGLCLIGEGEDACLYAESGMTGAYARLAHRVLRAEAAELIAETVAEESRLYSRPTPASLFAGPPFGLAPEAIAAALARFARDPGREEISQVTTSDGQLYLYSRRYLLPQLATSLAEWYAVGQFASP